jgi:hypothetical protein
VPDFPRPSISFPAFQTPAGLVAQADREHRADYASTQGMARELSRRTDGAWVPIPYSPGRFGPVQWLVGKKTFNQGRYKIRGNEIDVSFDIQGDVIAPTVNLWFVLPERLRARHTADGSIYSVAAGVGKAALVYIQRGTSLVQFYQLSFPPWPVANVQVAGQLTIEVEEF